MFNDDDDLLESAYQHVQIQRNLELIDQMVALKEKELQREYNDKLSGRGAEDSTSSCLLNPSSREFVFKTGFQLDDDDDNDEDSILELLLDDDDNNDEDDEDPTQGMTELEKAEYLKMREGIEKREQEFQRELEKKKKEQEAFDKMTPEEQKEFEIKKQLSVYRSELIEIAKGNQDRFDQLAVSKGVLDGDMVELEKQQDIMNGRRAITGEHLDF